MWIVDVFPLIVGPHVLPSASEAVGLCRPLVEAALMIRQESQSSIQSSKCSQEIDCNQKPPSALQTVRNLVWLQDQVHQIISVNKSGAAQKVANAGWGPKWPETEHQHTNLLESTFNRFNFRLRSTFLMGPTGLFTWFNLGFGSN